MNLPHTKKTKHTVSRFDLIIYIQISFPFFSFSIFSLFLCFSLFSLLNKHWNKRWKMERTVGGFESLAALGKRKNRNQSVLWPQQPPGSQFPESTWCFS